MDIREEILRKRRAGKLPGDTTSVLKAWWQSHSKWPYPTVSLSNYIPRTHLSQNADNNISYPHFSTKYQLTLYCLNSKHSKLKLYESFMCDSFIFDVS